MNSFKIIFLFSLVAFTFAQSEIDQIIDIFTQLTQLEYGQGNPWLRQAHAKQHGCVTALVNVDQNLPSYLAKGIFTPGAEYAAFIRFSNGVARGFTPLLQANESDHVPDIRGLGIKLVNVSGNFIRGNSQTFTFTTSRVAFLDTLENSLSFFQAIQSGNFATTAWLATHPILAALYAKQGIDGAISDLLTADWWAPIATMHGDIPAKYRLYPCPAKKSERKVSYWDFNELRDNLLQDLSDGYGCFNWAVQLYDNEDTTPVNDSTVEWDTPFTDIATVYIPPQVFGSPKQETYCRWLSFTPEDTIPEHAPVGTLQDIRSAVYTAMATLRHQLKRQTDTDATYKDWLSYHSW